MEKHVNCIYERVRQNMKKTTNEVLIEISVKSLNNIVLGHSPLVKRRKHNFTIF